MNSSKTRQQVVIASAESGDSGAKLDQLLLSSVICNGEHSSPFIRKTFASSKSETLLHYLRHFCRSKEAEIEEVFKESQTNTSKNGICFIIYLNFTKMQNPAFEPKSKPDGGGVRQR
ncbi:hypothetical protein L2E82_29114 [Cichorium intybus]|uniref:Uncharacterized protein n=1 Tax=Cichorium intybus TaxID=13427 RepID=A0ACB9CX70_CICIN|nr:hypothetical protein L2E82_29114 [Cichorium intybus]